MFSEEEIKGEDREIDTSNGESKGDEEEVAGEGTEVGSADRELT